MKLIQTSVGTAGAQTPAATEVLLVGDWVGGRNVPMNKAESGIWSVTTAPLQPDLYAYSFSVNGVRTLDPGNYNSGAA